MALLERLSALVTFPILITLFPNIDKDSCWSKQPYWNTINQLELTEQTCCKTPQYKEVWINYILKIYLIDQERWREKKKKNQDCSLSSGMIYIARRCSIKHCNWTKTPTVENFLFHLFLIWQYKVMDRISPNTCRKITVELIMEKWHPESFY